MEKFEKYKENIIIEIKEIFKDNLVSIITYGSYVKGRYIYKKSDINLMIIRDKRDNNELIGLNKFYRKYYSKLNLALPLILTLNEIKTSTDVYPMEYMDIKDHHKVLYGKDLFKELKIDLKNLRLELENQVKSKLINLRESLIDFYKQKKKLKLILLNSLSSMIVILKNILKLNNKDIPADTADLITIASELTGFKLTALEKLITYKNRQIKYNNNQILSLYSDYIKEFEGLADYVDKFKVKKK